jgi:hypothetical protein
MAGKSIVVDLDLFMIYSGSSVFMDLDPQGSRMFGRSLIRNYFLNLLRIYCR